jgi:hypothetical protein
MGHNCGITRVQHHIAEQEPNSVRGTVNLGLCHAQYHHAQHMHTRMHMQ